MQDQILTKASELFLTYGFKSVTMDDIAQEMGISKKTIYKLFANKENLVDACTMNVQQTVDNMVKTIEKQGYNAIEENFEIKNIFKKKFEKSKTSPMFQLKKYYPKTFKKLIDNEFCTFQECLISNLENGIKQELYRSNIHVEMAMKFYYILVFGVYEKGLFGHNMADMLEVELCILEYHTRAIATEKGLEELEKQLIKFKQ